MSDELAPICGGTSAELAEGGNVALELSFHLGDGMQLNVQRGRFVRGLLGPINDAAFPPRASVTFGSQWGCAAGPTRSEAETPRR